VLLTVGDSRLAIGREAGAIRVGRASTSWPPSSEKGVGDGDWKTYSKISKNKLWTVWTSISIYDYLSV